jgi:hypothetical protein
MNDKLSNTDPAATAPDTPKKDGTPDPGDCCVVPPGGGDPGPGGPTG